MTLILSDSMNNMTQMINIHTVTLLNQCQLYYNFYLMVKHSKVTLPELKANDFRAENLLKGNSCYVAQAPIPSKKTP